MDLPLLAPYTPYVLILGGIIATSWLIRKLSKPAPVVGAPVNTAVKIMVLFSMHAVTKWLQGVIVVQILTTEERENIVEAANGYFKAIEEDEKIKAVEALIDYLEEMQTYCHCKVVAGESVNVRQISKTTET